MNPIRRVRPACCPTWMGAIFVLAAMPTAQGQTAEDILNKADAIYSSATSYQAIYHWERQEFDKRDKIEYTSSEMIEVKTNGTTKFRLHKVWDKLNGHKRSYEFSRNPTDIVDDGQSEYTYQSGEKDYSRSRHFDLAFTAEYFKGAYSLLPVLKPRKGFTYTLLAPATVKGKAAYVIEAAGSLEKTTLNLPHWNKGHTIEVFFMPVKIMEKNEERFYIDQATYHLLQREAKYTQPGNSAKITQLIQSEVFNAPLPDSTFVFVAPPGVKEADYSVQKFKPRRVGATK